MTSVSEQAIEAGARAIASRYDDNIIPGPILEELPIIARAQWPILSAGLRELHRPYTVYDWDGACPDASEAHTEAHHHEDNVGDWYCDTLPIGSVCDSCRDEDGDRMDWPCATERWRRSIDEELGL